MSNPKSVRSGSPGGALSGKEAASTQPWHQLESEEIVRLLEADLRHGLRADDVRRRQEKYGPNRVTAQRHSSGLKRFLLQFN
jgi:magnesium-transporting ATPase (P-type)